VKRRWMLVADPRDPANEMHVAAAKAWNRQYARERANRFWTRAGAVTAIAEVFDPTWGNWVHYRIERVAEHYAGWH
jgi:hypothetical protein